MSSGPDPIPVTPTPCWHESVLSARTDSIVALSMQSAHIKTSRPLPPGTAVFLELGENAGIDAVSVNAFDDGFAVDFVTVDAAARDIIAAAINAARGESIVVDEGTASAADNDAAFDAVPVTSVPRAETPTAQGGHLSAAPLPRTRTDELFAQEAALSARPADTNEAFPPEMPTSAGAPARVPTSPLAMPAVGQETANPPADTVGALPLDPADSLAPPPPALLYAGVGADDEAALDADDEPKPSNEPEPSTEVPPDDVLDAPARPTTLTMFANELQPPPAPPEMAPAPSSTIQMLASDMAPPKPSAPATASAPTSAAAAPSATSTMQMLAIDVAPPKPATAPAPSATSTMQMLAIDVAPPKPAPAPAAAAPSSTMQMLASDVAPPKPAAAAAVAPSATSTMQMLASDVSPPKPAAPTTPGAAAPAPSATATMQMLAIDVAPTKVAPAAAPSATATMQMHAVNAPGLDPPRTTTPTAPIVAAPRPPADTTEPQRVEVSDVAPPPVASWSKALGMDVGNAALFGDDEDKPVSQTQRWPVARATSTVPTDAVPEDDGSTARWPVARAALNADAADAGITLVADEATSVASGADGVGDINGDEEDLVLADDEVSVDVGEEISTSDAAVLNVTADPVAAASSAPVPDFENDGEDIVLEFTERRPAVAAVPAAPPAAAPEAPSIPAAPSSTRPLPPPEDEDGGVIDVDFSEFQDVLGVSTFQSSGAPPPQAPRTTTPIPVSVTFPRTPSASYHAAPSNAEARNPFGGDSDVSRTTSTDSTPPLPSPQVMPQEAWVVSAGTPSFPSPRLLDTELDPVLRQSGGPRSATPKPMPFVGDSSPAPLSGDWTVAPSAQALAGAPVSSTADTVPPMRLPTTPPTATATAATPATSAAAQAPAPTTVSAPTTTAATGSLPPRPAPLPTATATATAAAAATPTPTAAKAPNAFAPFAPFAAGPTPPPATPTPTAPNQGVGAPAPRATAASLSPVSPSSEGLPLVVGGAIITDDDDDIPVVIGGDPTTPQS